MIEIKETTMDSLDRIAERAAKYEKIAPLARAWAKVDRDEDQMYSEDQKNNVTLSCMSAILRIVEGVNV